MTIAYWCVLIAGLLPYAAVGFAKYQRGYNNRDPRGWEERLEGRKKRAHSAHLNSFEAFPLFAAGVIVAHLAKAPQGTLDALAVGFIAVRVAYIYLYIADLPTPRSLVWLAGLSICVALFVISAFTS